MQTNYQTLFPAPPQTPARPQADSEGPAPSPSEMRWVLAHGALAPSGGNFQPWKFRYVDGRLSCLFDADRTRYFTNFRNSETHISLGAAVTNIELASRVMGFATELTHFPSGDGDNPVCEIAFRREPCGQEAAELAAAIPYRMTSRKRGARVPLESEDRHALGRLAHSSGAELLFVTDPEQLADAGVILGKLNRIAYLNQESHRGNMTMLRWSPEEAAKTRDGIDITTLELSPVELAGVRLLASYQVAKYMNNMGVGRALESMPVAWAKTASALCLLLLARPPSPCAYFEAGRILERLWLAATVRGLSFHVLGVNSYFDRLEHGAGAGFSAEELVVLSEARARYKTIFDIPPEVCEAVLFRIVPPNLAVARTPRRDLDELMA